MLHFQLPDSSEGIQQVSCCISSVIQHFVKGEDIVIQPVMGKISIFDNSHKQQMSEQPSVPLWLRPCLFLFLQFVHGAF